MNVREWALPVYTVLIQLASGAMLIFWVSRRLVYSRYSGQEWDRITRIPILILFLTVCLAVAGAHLHLSRPFLSLLAVRNFAHSWLSREIAFTIFFFLSMALLTILHWFVPGRQLQKEVVGWMAIVFGLATVYCMSSIYMLPTQIVWDSTTGFFSNYGDMLLLGGTAFCTILLMNLNFYYAQDPQNARRNEGGIGKLLMGLGNLSAAALLFTLFFDAIQIVTLCALCDESAQTSMQLLFGLYQPLFVLRLGLSILGVGWLFFIFRRANNRQESPRALMGSAYIASSMVLVGEILGRFLFYAIHVRIGI